MRREQRGDAESRRSERLLRSLGMTSAIIVEIPSAGHAMMSHDEAPSDAELDEFFARKPVLPEADQNNS